MACAFTSRGATSSVVAEEAEAWRAAAVILERMSKYCIMVTPVCGSLNKCTWYVCARRTRCRRSQCVTNKEEPSAGYNDDGPALAMAVYEYTNCVHQWR